MQALLILMTLCSFAHRVTIASSYNPLITNGTCYFKAGEKMVDEYSPCGNAALSNYWCCQLGDACASENACYNFGTGTTYLAGCTDPTYEDSTCPDKGPYSDQEWTGLVRCHVSDDFSKQQELWAACEDDEQPLVVLSNLSKSCHCDTENPDFTTAVVFTAGPGLVNFATLPEQKGKSIMWAAGMTPTTFEFTGSATSTATSTSTHETGTSLSLPNTTADSNSPSSTSLNIPPTSDSTQSSDTRTGLSTGAKVGISLSTLGAVLSIIAAGYFIGRLVRKRRAKKYEPDNASKICCYSGRGSRCGDKGSAGELVIPHVMQDNNGGDMSAGQPEARIPVIDHGVATILANTDGARSLRGTDRESSISVSALSPSVQDGRSSTYTRDGSRASWASPEPAIQLRDQTYQYQPYRPEQSQAQHKLPEIAELPAFEGPTGRTAHAEKGSRSDNGDDGCMHNLVSGHHTADTRETNVDAGRLPSHGLSTRDQIVHELPG